MARDSDAPYADGDAPRDGERVRRRLVFKRRMAYTGVPLAILVALAVIPFPLCVTEPCVVLPLERAQVRSEVGGLIETTLVAEGERVTAGQPIARLDDTNTVHELRAARAQVDRLSAPRAELRAGHRPEEIESADAETARRRQEMAYAREHYERTEGLRQQGIASAQQRDDALRDLRVAEQALVQARSQQELTRSGPRIEAVAMAEADLARAQADLEYFDDRLSKLTIRSPVAGRVLTPRFHERVGEWVEEGDLVAEIGDPKAMRAEIYVPERFADVVALGQPVELKVHAYPLRAFYGEVSFIAPAVSTHDGRRILRVESEIDNADERLQSGMSGYAEIDTGDRSLLELGLRRAVRWIRVRFLI